MNGDYAVETLREFVRIPSTAEHPTGLLEGAEFAERQLSSLGFRVWRRGPREKPVLFAELAGADDRHLLFYNHYDVTDPGPQAAWNYPPFSAHVHEGTLSGRGSSDHKASFIARLAAIRSLLEDGQLPIGIKFLLDSEEELGSPRLETILQNHAGELSAAGGLYSGGALDENDRPVIRAGSKGMCSLELRVRAAPRQMHSKWAAILPNPAWQLIRALNTMYDADTDTVLLPGFRAGIEPPDQAARAALRGLDFGIEAFKAEFRPTSIVPPVESSSILERLMFEPTFNLAFFNAGDGGRTVLPGEAVAILDIRLVPGQDSGQITRQVKDHIASLGLDDVTVTVLGTSEADRCALSDPTVVALEKATTQVYGMAAQVHPSGAGSGPRYLFRKYLGISLVQDPGASWSGSNDHGPNENIRISDYLKNLKLIRRFVEEYPTL